MLNSSEKKKNTRSEWGGTYVVDLIGDTRTNKKKKKTQ